MSESITYNHGGVADFASDVGTRSAQLMEIHDDILHRTNAIADFFSDVEVDDMACKLDIMLVYEVYVEQVLITLLLLFA